MRIFISVDMEGASGVFAEEQTTLGTEAYRQACRLLRADVDAAIEGCLAAGATAITVADGHEKGSNLSAEGLPPQARLASGTPTSHSMMHGIAEGYDAALMVGYHAMAGTAGAVLDHTYSYDVFRVRLDEYLEVGECGINAGLAGVYGVPVVFVSGDDKLAAEAAELLPGVECAVVKYGTMRTAARLLPPETTQAIIRDGVTRALRERRWPAPLDLAGKPLRVTFTRTAACDAASLLPGVQRVDGRTLDIPGGDYRTVFHMFLACTSLASQVRA